MKIVADDKIQLIKDRQDSLKKMGKDLGKSKQAKQLLDQVKNNWDEEKQGKMDDISIGLVLSAMISEMI